MITLNASSLASKWGFEDGALLLDLTMNRKNSYKAVPGSHLGYDHEVLARCVETFLIPALPLAIRTQRIGTSHNPIRVHPDDAHLLDQYVTVEVPKEDILKIIGEVDMDIENDRTPLTPERLEKIRKNAANGLRPSCEDTLKLTSMLYELFGVGSVQGWITENHDLLRSCHSNHKKHKEPKWPILGIGFGLGGSVAVILMVIFGGMK